MKYILGLLFCLPVLSPLARADDASSKMKALLDRSPFQGQPGIASSAGEPVDSLEFRAVLEEHHGVIFSLFEKDRHYSTWLELNKPVNNITVSEYDAATLTLKVIYQGKTLVLPLKGAKPPGTRAAFTPPPQPDTPAAADTEYQDQPFRIGHVAEEIEIREVMRQTNKPLDNSRTEPAKTLIE